MDDISTCSNSDYSLRKDKLQLFRKEFIVLVSRVLLEFFPSLHALESLIPKQIRHGYSEEMAKKSVIINLPFVPLNQSKHSDELLVKIWKSKETCLPTANKRIMARIFFKTAIHS